MSDNDDGPSVRSLDVPVVIHYPDDGRACVLIVCGRRLWLTILMSAVHSLMQCVLSVYGVYCTIPFHWGEAMMSCVGKTLHEYTSR